MDKDDPILVPFIRRMEIAHLEMSLHWNDTESGVFHDDGSDEYSIDYCEYCGGRVMIISCVEGALERHLDNARDDTLDGMCTIDIEEIIARGDPI